MFTAREPKRQRHASVMVFCRFSFSSFFPLPPFPKIGAEGTKKYSPPLPLRCSSRFKLFRQLAISTHLSDFAKKKRKKGCTCPQRLPRRRREPPQHPCTHCHYGHRQPHMFAHILCKLPGSTPLLWSPAPPLPLCRNYRRTSQNSSKSKVVCS